MEIKISDMVIRELLPDVLYEWNQSSPNFILWSWLWSNLIASPNYIFDFSYYSFYTAFLNSIRSAFLCDSYYDVIICVFNGVFFSPLKWEYGFYNIYSLSFFY